MEQIRPPLTGTPLVLPQASHPCGTALDMPLHPADELAQIRAELARLHKREAALRSFFRDDATEHDLLGDVHEVTIIAHKKRTFDPSKLPQSILANPRFYRDELRTLVSTALKPSHQPYHALPPMGDSRDTAPSVTLEGDILPI
ncbi:hypothetical protein SAMN04488030_3084 [Aliiroseovarius halocynthiae]|uniref:Uncharacterized protein n=1 Tax=Aliiroseovarius halocynthiae TaxID=985055 RepID=A0A545SMN0_9RHOB|nr:hypothetical protein [Aliiroseovarius halocynthiae]TQV66116.1 hypothetical protein FIL88_15225 [Aliiroseovarius halocynthiae]SMR83173.1 hypothetical protein SAMN04488030_3084 [Aliiroseovarius halocynthiae]